MTGPTVSCVIPVYIPKSDNSASVLAELNRCIRGLQHYSQPQFVEILIQDDCSPGLSSLEGALPPFVRLERNARNLGFAGNCNAGAARAQGRVLLFVNQDTLPLTPWYEPLLATFNAGATTGHKIGLVGPKLLFPPQSAPPDEHGLLALQSCGGWYDAAGQPPHRYLGYREDYPEANRTEEVSWITGAIHCWERQAFERIGGYDTEYQGGYFEDVDACCRVQQAGYRVYYCHESRWLHQVGTSNAVKARQFQANAERFRLKWVTTGLVSKDTPAVHESWWAA